MAAMGEYEPLPSGVVEQGWSFLAKAVGGLIGKRWRLGGQIVLACFMVPIYSNCLVTMICNYGYDI